MAIQDIVSLLTVFLNLFFLGLLVHSVFLFYRYCMFNRNFSVYSRGVPIPVLENWEKAKLNQMRWLIWTPWAWIVVLLNAKEIPQMAIGVLFLIPIIIGFKYGSQAKLLKKTPEDQLVPAVVNPEIEKKLSRIFELDKPLSNMFRFNLTGQEILTSTRKTLVSTGLLMFFITLFEKDPLAFKVFWVHGTILIVTGFVPWLRLRGLIMFLSGSYYLAGMLLARQMHIVIFAYIIVYFYWVMQIFLFQKKALNKHLETINN
ncbi:MAG: hypothetical protein IPO76_10160 [Elusimicrobia bacterium]|nr:hypothetical protein [Elusimicrobiota bacterium]MBP9050049.1 hypothetical protein [Alphaproteobacteria bacterium]MBK7575418.1 hypothetical protein [Elusimicrobiota bacterium]MBK9695735.1 hypothetical protein [Elusimicrobiota bacterium]MBK9922223.1 hypothetical protein [Elusimicrobiota bacterium]